MDSQLSGKVSLADKAAALTHTVINVTRIIYTSQPPVDSGHDDINQLVQELSWLRHQLLRLEYSCIWGYGGKQLDKEFKSKNVEQLENMQKLLADLLTRLPIRLLGKSKGYNKQN